MTTIAERSPSHAPWEKHPTDGRRTVGSVLDGDVVAATTSAPVGVALVKAVLCLSNACAESGKVPANEVVPAVRKHPGTRTRPDVEVMP